MDRRDSNSPVGCMHASASDNDMEGHFSAATTQPSSPRSFLRAGSPQMKNAPWVQVQDRLLKFAEEGDADVDACGELVSCQIAIERFLHGNKDNVEKAAQQMRAHFRWRREERIDCVIHEDFSDLETCEELYWAGKDLGGVPTLTWILRNHDPGRTPPARFVRFLVAQIERGLRRETDYPNSRFNIFVDMEGVGLGNNDGDMIKILQKTLVQNYPKIRKGLYVFPVNWLIALLWESILKPLLSTLQPDINDKLSPLRGEYLPQLLRKYDISQIEEKFGGGLDLVAHVPAPFQPYAQRSLSAMRREHEAKQVFGQAALTASKLAKEKASREHGTPTSPLRRRVAPVPGWIEPDSSSSDSSGSGGEEDKGRAEDGASGAGMRRWRVPLAVAVTAACSRACGLGGLPLAACVAAGTAAYLALSKVVIATLVRPRRRGGRDAEAILARLRGEAAALGAGAGAAGDPMGT